MGKALHMHRSYMKLSLMYVTDYQFMYSSMYPHVYAGMYACIKVSIRVYESMYVVRFKYTEAVVKTVALAPIATATILAQG